MQRCCYWFKRVSSAQAAGRFVPGQHGQCLNLRLFTEQAGKTIPQDETPLRHRQYSSRFVPESLLPPRYSRSDPDAWIAILQHVVPERLLQEHELHAREDAAGLKEELSPSKIAGILALARRNHDLDLLQHLAEQGRWRVLLWLVTHLVDSLWTHNPLDRPKLVDGPWHDTGNLDQATEDDVFPDGASILKQLKQTTSVINLEDHLGYSNPLDRRARANDGHAVLGQIWQSLGRMILADSKHDSTITSEILEIIALLHHRGIMPDTIYSYTPYIDRTALRQPPTLHLLSSHILTSLSDAVWRAHETAVLEDAKVKGGLFKSPRPEIPGSMYRVRVGGLRHEVWLELVLWACLQGGWTTYGAAILEAMSKQDAPNKWSALSWREAAIPMVRAGEEQAIDWNEVRYLFNTGTHGNPDDNAEQRSKIAKTVSSEVVTAYVDALLNLVRVGVGERGIAPGAVLTQIMVLKSFLERNNLGLESSSWDTVVMRMFGSSSINIEKEPGLAERVLDLSPPYGRELATRNAPTRDEQWQPLSPYLLDGTAAPLGIAHRILQAHLQAGNLAGALRSFQALQARTDRSKKRSIEEFFQLVKNNQAPETHAGINFESPYARIHYPGFHTQIPVTTLGPLLDLVTSARALTFGSWLLQSSDPDGPTITESMYSSSAMIPPLIRFASATHDRELLGKILERYNSAENTRERKPSAQMQVALLGIRLQFNDWSSARSIINGLADSVRASTTSLAIALLVRAIFRLSSAMDPAASVEERSNLKQAIELYALVARSKPFNVDSPARSSLILMISTVMASINDDWAQLVWKVRQPPDRIMFDLDKEPFNIVLDGIVDGYGGEVGKRVLASFWQPARDDVKSAKAFTAAERDEDQGGIAKMPTERPGAYADVSPNRVSMELRRPKRDPFDNENIVKVIGRFKPNISTIRIVLRALLQSKDTSELARTRAWALRVLRQLDMKDRDIEEELKGKFNIVDTQAEFEIAHPANGEETK